MIFKARSAHAMQVVVHVTQQHAVWLFKDVVAPPYQHPLVPIILHIIVFEKCERFFLANPCRFSGFKPGVE